MRAHSETLQRLVDPRDDSVSLKALAAEFSMPHRGPLPQGRKRATRTPVYSAGVLRELQTDPRRKELQEGVRRALGPSTERAPGQKGRNKRLKLSDVEKVPPLFC